MIRPMREQKPCGAKEGRPMIKKREVATVLALLGAVCALCIREMKKVGERLENDRPPRPPVNQEPEFSEGPGFDEASESTEDPASEDSGKDR